jgi:serine/threonine protein kinase
MSIDSVQALVQALKQSQLLETAQVKELEALQYHCPDPRVMLRELLQREWLTAYQANQVLKGAAKDLILGPYLLLARIGDGVLGQVFKAMHRRMKRLVALKVIRAELLARPEAVERFYEETQIISQLSDPHIVHAYDAGPIGQTHFFAMEYVEGLDLETLIGQSGPLPFDVATDFVLQTAQGLQHAFERNLSHGDLKPANLLVTRTVGAGAPSGTGSWRSILASAPGGGALVKINNLGLTFLQTPGAVPAGTAAMPISPDYLAPERWQQPGAGDIRSDLYALGCIYYFLLSGRVPFAAGTVEEKRRRHLTEEPAPLQHIRKDVPAGTVAIISTLMAKRPQYRYQAPAEVVQALRAGRAPAAPER